MLHSPNEGQSGAKTERQTFVRLLLHPTIIEACQACKAGREESHRSNHAKALYETEHGHELG